MRHRVIEGIKPRSTCPKIPHLLFADDSLFFLKGTMGNVHALKAILDEYCKVSGQRVKFAKSSLFCGVDHENLFAMEVAEVFGMNLVRDPGKYLGLPKLWGRSKSEALGFLRSRISNKIQGWRSKLLTMRVRKF